MTDEAQQVKAATHSKRDCGTFSTILCTLIRRQLFSEPMIEVHSLVNKGGGVGFTSLNMFISQQAAGPAHAAAGWEIPVMDASLHAAWFTGLG